MPINSKYLATFCQNEIYHIYNRTNNHELLFRSDENYRFFLQQFDIYISPIADSFAWCLLPNHFHFLIRINPIEKMISSINEASKQTKSQQHFLLDQNVNTLVEMEFKRLFTSYAMAFNSMYKRKGNLFSRTFKRVNITKDNYFTQAVIYIHANAQKHKMVKDFKKYEWNSYHSILSDKSTRLLRSEILDWFGGKQQFIQTHEDLSHYYYGFPGDIEGA